MTVPEEPDPPPPRPPQDGLITVLVCAIIVMLVAGITGAVVVRNRGSVRITIRLAAPPSPTTASPSKVCPVVPAAAVPATGALLAQVLLTPPPGFVQQPDPSVHGGVLSAAELVANSQDQSQAAAELRNDGFEGAVLRVWIDDGSAEQAQETLVEFSCAAGASEYFHSQVAGALGVTSAQPFVVDGLNGAQGERSTAADAKGHYLQAIGVVSGAIYSQTATFTPFPDDGGLVGSISNLQVGTLAPV